MGLFYFKREAGKREITSKSIHFGNVLPWNDNLLEKE